jgi:hypothetical protein
VLVPFGPYAPDKPARLNDGVTRTASGVFPMPDGYRPVGQWAQIIPALAAQPRGGASFTSPTGVSSIIAGTATGLYRGLTGGFSLLQAGYSLQDEGRWRFAQFGGLAIATNGSDPMQKIDLTEFTVSVLGGEPPRTETVAVVKDFLVGGVINGNIMAVAWSGINNAESWTYGANQADYQIFPDGGRINGLLSGETGLALQRSALRRMDYVGGNLVFTIDNTHPGVGCVSPHTVGQWGRTGWFWSDLGPMEWDGAEVTLIGDEIITRDLQARYDKTTWPQISTAVDPVNGVVLWSCPDQTVVYHWRLKRWATIPYASPIIFGGVTRDISIDEQDPAVGTPDDVIDSVGLLSLDDASFKGGDPRLYVFSSDYKLGAFTGTPMEATLRLGDLQPVVQARCNVREVRIETDAIAGITLTLAHKERLGDTAANDNYTTITASGHMPVRTSGRYISPTVTITAGTDWSYIQAIDLTATKAGGR